MKRRINMDRNEAIMKVKYLLCGLCYGQETRQALDMLIPDLWETEDEKTRKKIIETLQDIKDNRNGVPRAYYNDENIDKMIAYLENLGKEEKGEEKNDIDLDEFVKYVETLAKAYEFKLPKTGPDVYQFCRDIYIRLRPAMEETRWTNEDEQVIDIIKDALKTSNAVSHKNYMRAMKWLDAAPKTDWKPTEEEMKALRIAKSAFQSRGSVVSDKVYTGLKEIEDHLKNL